MDNARTRFEELGRSAPDLNNLSTRTFARVVDLFEREAWDEIAGCYSDAAFIESRRPGLGHDTRGPEGAVEGWKAAYEVGATRARRTTLAVRGDRLSLTRVVFLGTDESPGAPSLEVLFLNEVNDDGLIVTALLFDGNDVDAARRQLDVQYAAGDASQRNAASEGMKRLEEAFERKDWDGFRASLSDAHENVDRRRGLQGSSIGAEFTVETFKIMFESLGLVRMESEVVATRGDSLALARGLVFDVTGNEIALYLLFESDEQGLVKRTVYFDADQLDAAHTELEAR
jgi:hypothetical protein